jgi:hypothetical protein
VLSDERKIEKREEQYVQLSIRYTLHHLIDIQRYKREKCLDSFKNYSLNDTNKSMWSRQLFLVWFFTLTILTTQSHVIHVCFIDIPINL